MRIRLFLSCGAVFITGMAMSYDRPAPNVSQSRSEVMARNGAIATSHPLASSAGLQVLLEGGNAVDAAVTAAAVLLSRAGERTGLLLPRLSGGSHREFPRE